MHRQRSRHHWAFKHYSLSVCLSLSGFYWWRVAISGSCDLLLLSPLVEWPSGRGLVGLFEGFEERGVLGNDMITECLGQCPL